TAPSSPSGLSASPSGWTNTNSFTVSWTNPPDTSGIAGAYYKLDSAPTSNTDGTYVSGSGITSISGITVPSEGSHTIYVWLQDAAGNVNYNYCSFTTLYYDTTAPSSPSGLTASPSGWTNTNSFTVSWTNPPDTSGIAGAYYRLDSAPNSNTDGTYVSGSGITSISGITVSGDGSHTIYVWLVDAAGNVNYSNRSSTTLYYDATPPTGSIVINNGDTYTNSTSVTLSFTYSDATSDVYQVRYSNDGIWDNEPWELPSASKSWTLTSGDGTKTVYYQIKDVAGNVSSTYSDSIILDTTSPTAPSGLRTNPSTSEDNYSSDAPQLEWDDASDNLSGVFKYQIRTDRNPEWIDFTKGALVPAGYIFSSSVPNVIYVRAVDAAGNFSQEASIYYYYDNTPPSIVSVAIAEGENEEYQHIEGNNNTIYYNNTSASGSFVVTILASDDESGIRKVVFPQLTDFASPNGGENASMPALWTYRWTIFSTHNGLASITVYNKAGLDATVNISVYRDVNQPSGGFIWYENIYQNTTSVSVQFEAGSDSGAGLGLVILQRSSASLSNGEVGSWGDFSDLAVNPLSPYLDNAVSSGVAYRYRLLVYDRVNNCVIYDLENSVKIDTGLPSIQEFCLRDLETGSPTFAKFRTVKVKIQENDAESGVWKWYLSENPSQPSPENFGSKPDNFLLSEGDGQKTVYAWVMDRAGNISERRSWSIILDTVPPTGTIVINDNENYTNSPNAILALTWYDASGQVLVRYSNDGATWTDWMDPENVKAWMLPTVDGIKTVYCQLTDAAGNVTTISDTIVLDTTSDSILWLTSTTHPDENGWYSDNEPFFRWGIPPSISPIEGYSIWLDRDNDTIPDERVDLSENCYLSSDQLADGVWFFHVRAGDAAGNWGPASHFRVQIDVTPDGPPVVQSPTHPDQSRWYDQQLIEVWWSPAPYTSPVVGYLWCVDNNEDTIPSEGMEGVENTTENSALLYAIFDGIWYFHVRAKDAAGNWGQTAHFRFNIDTQPPVAPALLLPENGSILADNRPTFRWGHQEGDIENYELEIYDNAGSLFLADNSPVKWYDPENALPNGQYRWRVRAVDRAGNLGAWSENF
ncbi:MAG: hypothetical protein QW356_08795, partial [Candidatus Hadarchaeales archaeon]